jgi:hypothetical protein
VFLLPDSTVFWLPREQVALVGQLLAPATAAFTCMSSALCGAHLLHSYRSPACCSRDTRACPTPQRILKLEYELPPRIAVSPEAHSLLAAMLVAQPEQRISIQQASLQRLAGRNTSTLCSGAHRRDCFVMLDQYASKLHA